MSGQSVTAPRRQCARRTVRLTQQEAVPFAVMTGLTDPFMVPYALALGASAFQAGLVSSVRNLVLSVSQLGVVRALHGFGSRKRLVLWAVAIQAALWVPIALARPLFGPWAVPALIALFTIGSTGAALAGPAWGSIVGDQIPARRRGAFFGRREMLVGLGTAAAGIAGGAILRLLTREPLLGFGILCVVAALCRAASWVLLSRLDERPWHEPATERVPFLAFLARARSDNFVRFTLCMGLFNFAVNLTVPYLSVYMLEQLRYGYLTYAVVTLSGPLIGNLVVPRWGRLGDARGNRVLLRWTMLATGLLPLLWPWSGNPGWLLWLHVAGGIVWGGVNLSAVNFVYDASSSGSRARLLAYFNVINGCCVSLGTVMGGWLLTVLPEVRGTAFTTLFLLSALCRGGAAVVFDRLVREVRPIHQVGLREVLRDLAGQRVIQVLGYFSVRPERERRTGAKRERGGGAE
jgi:MFS family permease